MDDALLRFLMDASQRWTAWMLDVSILLVPVVVVLAAWTWMRPRSSPRLLYALWLLALLRLVLPPEFSLPTGWGWWVRPPQSGDAVTVRWVGADQSDVVEKLQRPSPPVGSRGGLGTATDTVRPSGGQDRATLGPTTLTRRLPDTWCLVLMLAWLGVVAARLGMLTTAALQVRLWIARAPPIQDAGLWELLADACRQVGFRRAIDLRNSEACATPLVVGWWRPVVLLPATVIERLDRRELLAVFVHELHHVKRADPLISWAQGLLGAVYFFHPLVWWSNRQLRRWREDACDELTIATLQGQRGMYGRALLKVAEIVGYVPPPVVLGILDSPTPARQRLARILEGPNPPRTRPWLCYLPVAGLAAVLLPGGSPPGTSVAATNVTRPTAAMIGPGPEAVKEASAEPPIDGPAVGWVSDPPASPSPSPDNRRLCYRWRPGMRFSYACQIEVEHISWQEIFTGKTQYVVESADEQGAVLVMTGRLATRYTGDDLPAVLPHERRFNPRSPYNALAGSGMARHHRLRVSPAGDFQTLDGGSELPYYLGDLATLPFVSTPEAPAETWTSTTEMILRIGDPEYIPPSYWPSGAPAIELPDAKVTSTYTMRGVADGVVNLDKTLNLRSIFESHGEPQHEVTGTATVQFSLFRGLPLNYQARLVIFDRMMERIERMPVTFTCRLEPDSPSSSPGEAK